MIGDKIRQRRLELGLTQIQLSEKTDIKKNTISNYENNITSPSEENLIRLINALKCDANFLFEDEMNIIKTDRFSFNEKTLIKKYRTLDKYGKQAIDNLLDVEYNRCTVSENKEKTVKMFKVARSSDGEKPQTDELTQEEHERLLKAVEMDDNEL